MNSLFPEIAPFHTYWLETGSVHRVYVEQSGNPAGLPVIFLHGGPCSGTKPDHRRFFDPIQYHIILMDQRGCGKSLPFGEISANTTADLLADMEAIRKQLRIEQWLLFGGSWGATLALVYAQAYRPHVAGLILRGVFLARQADMDWFLENGVNHIYPQQWQNLLDSIPGQVRHDISRALCEVVFSDDTDAAKCAAKQWLDWGALVALGNDFSPDAEVLTDQGLQQARMELHYAKNAYFITENQILANCAILQTIPIIIVHGQHDLTCPLESGWLLHKALPQARFIVLPNAGHIARGAEMIDALVTATQDMAKIMLSADL